MAVPDYGAIVKHPVTFLATIGHRYREVWRMVDEARSTRTWPEWCFLPLKHTRTIIHELGQPFIKSTLFNEGEDLNASGDVLGCLAGWRVTKGIYVFDETVFEELWNTPITGNIPSDVLYKLPAWCCYIGFSSPRTIKWPFDEHPEGMGEIAGFFVHMEFDLRTKRTQLRIVLLRFAPGFALSIPIDIIGGNLAEAVAETFKESRRQFLTDPVKYRQAEDFECVALDDSTLEPFLQPFLSLVLYLCSTNAEINGPDARRDRPPITYTKRGPRLFPPDEPAVWEVAYRIGATLRLAIPKAPSEDQGGTHASPRPHIRRAHWHAFWVGEKFSEERRLELRWLHPILVGAENGIIPTVHRVAV